MTNNSKTAQTEKSISGYIYIVVFDNGTVKVGKSKFSPISRINSHVNAGIAFDVKLNSSFVMTIYEKNLISCENELISKISSISKCSQGREWFKFENLNNALLFAENYNKLMQKININKNKEVKNIEYKSKKLYKNQPFTNSPILDHSISIAGSQRNLAKQMNVSPGAVTQWKTKLPYKVALKLVEKYGDQEPRDHMMELEKKLITQQEETA